MLHHANCSYLSSPPPPPHSLALTPVTFPPNRLPVCGDRCNCGGLPVAQSCSFFSASFNCELVCVSVWFTCRLCKSLAGPHVSDHTTCVTSATVLLVWQHRDGASKGGTPCQLSAVCTMGPDENPALAAPLVRL
ncbi:hypothetical protein GN956_G5500 [Arapaima gigas]